MLGIGNLGRMVFGTSSDRRVKRYRPMVEAINALEDDVQRLSDDELRARTQTFRDQIAAGATLDDLLAPAFATVREAAKRTLGQQFWLAAIRPSRSSIWVALVFGSVSAPTPSWTRALGSSTPRENMPRGR